MVFTILCCADIVGHKVNLEVPFASPPTLAELKQRADQVFYEESQQLSRQGRLTPQAAELLATTVVAPGFDGRGVYSDSGLLSLGRVQVYDDSLLRWVDLVSPSQLHEYDQIYIFPKHRAHLSQVRDLPPPQPTGSALTRAQVGAADPNSTLNQPQQNQNVSFLQAQQNRSSTSPHRGSVIPPDRTAHGNKPETSPSRYSLAGHNNNNNNNSNVFAQDHNGFDIGVEELDKRQRQVFAIGDRNNNSYLSVDDFRSLFSRTKVLFNDVTITELFAMHAQNGRFMTFAEWQLFARHFPQLFAATYRRLVETQAETDMSNELELGAKRLLGLRDEQEDLLRRLKAIEGEISSQEQRSKDIAERLAVARSSRVPVEEEEQVVLEKEVRIHFQREMLSREENELKQASKRLDEKTASSTNSRSDVRRF